MKKSRNVTIGLVQMRCNAPTKKENLERALKGIREAAKKGANMVVLPELFLGQYFCQVPADEHAFDHAEPIPGPTTKALSAIAKELKIVLVGGSIYEKGSDGKYYNTSPVFESDGKLLGTYRKTHIPQDPGYYEQNYFEAAKNPVTVIETSLGNIAPLICFDQWSSEAARIAALLGAEILAYPTAIGNVSTIDQWEGPWQEGWEIAQRGHSAVNQVIVASVNRVGKEGDTTFWGGSFITGTLGQLKAHAAGDGEEIVIASVDLDLVARAQDSWGILRNRRPDLYGKLIEMPAKKSKKPKKSSR